MAIFNAAEQRFASTVSRMMQCNPFLPERIKLEREALGSDYVDASRFYYKRPGDELDHEHPNLTNLDERVEVLAEQARQRLTARDKADEPALRLYEDVVLYLLYRRYRVELHEAVVSPAKQPMPRVAFWERYLDDFNRFLRLPGRRLPSAYDPGELFAFFFQIRNAFHHVYHHIVGASNPVARLRGAIWQSIFTHDMRRYYRALQGRMADFATLITGPSGTGKELVARAIGLSRFVPFDSAKARFLGAPTGAFHALNLSALAPTLIESELFGHSKGAFTGAVRDRPGWLEQCTALGTVFLDEIGELDAAIQVKLLRVLQDRTLQRLGETEDRAFCGKIIAATHRDLAAEMRAGRFREDFYYRLCGDIITTPSLREQLADAPEDRRNLILFLARRVSVDEAETLADEVEAWIENHPILGRDYNWPGNFRELEQCVRNVLIRKEYHPARVAETEPDGDPRRQMANAILAGTLTSEELERRYFTLVYSQTNSYEETASRLGLDWRTVRGKIDRGLLKALSQSRGNEG